jgi:orotidine-5'-phosphate decarboxylase
MQFWDKYNAIVAKKNSMLCVGLDTTREMMPPEYAQLPTRDAFVAFNRSIIEATNDLAAAYKLNLAFYEQYGTEGWLAFDDTLRMIPKDCITIADAKRGDIGNTSRSYAYAFFDTYNCDALTVSPYMGRDSLAPFFEYKDRMTFVLALTSNAGSHDFQRKIIAESSNNLNAQPLYMDVIASTLSWTPHNNVGFVVGATHTAELAALRERFPTAFFLIPGVGAQGGDLAATLRANAGGAALINVSRGIIHTGDREAYPTLGAAARAAALRFLEEFRAVRTL